MTDNTPFHRENATNTRHGSAEKTIHCISLGCPKNRVDTERMLGDLGTMRPVDDIGQAKIVLINTCGFIAPAVEESTRVILEAAEQIKELSPRPLLVVAGCLVSRYGSELRTAIPEVDLWLAVEEERELRARLRPMADFELPAQDLPTLRALSTKPVFAYLKIGEGCNHRCHFCTIPSIRGPRRSMGLDAVVREAETILDQGVRELILVAQDLTAYGRDLGLRHGLETLLGRLARLSDLHWLRLMYLYPAGLTPRLLRFMAELGPPLLPYFDIPVQHAHPDILRAMGRPFAKDPRHTVERVREHFPDAALRTSVIVGYPGERPHHFQRLYDFVTETRFHHLGVFGFCPEAGTRAASLPGQVGTKTKAKRRDRLMELQAGISADILAQCQDQEMDVFVERPSPEWPGLFEGRVWFQAPEVDGMTYVSGVDIQPGDLVRAAIVETKTYDLVALR
ncbi:SSU ribosomal protein S12P methylthiotransferase [Desulfonatronum thiosulfatophilum]|uniref:Ribosomal protein uS12 methylthiotransferase RimO n=1 Tax=Desulfonatronum thiosulfatophilum TaxID=617002 RepID=A0A1G6CAP4_9BACT|nr:30S ribosomal protein S12 methylthiotransferase RimO [Desulfonatronum thiosulfatophilum]SDB29842.1 SSU ribosomal protein S12P methylthiotransferase [Desulfonatronum thiosulfatophilum]